MKSTIQSLLYMAPRDDTFTIICSLMMYNVDIEHRVLSGILVLVVCSSTDQPHPIIIPFIALQPLPEEMHWWAGANPIITILTNTIINSITVWISTTFISISTDDSAAAYDHHRHQQLSSSGYPHHHQSKDCGLRNDVGSSVHCYPEKYFQHFTIIWW